ncbi:YdbL family protein [Neptunicella sp. SCSIO 80796]|uniref:YdbL family protein n=1 Tax=Neptunicella plasticusilytica TaxID=3117012 RepID=UPI003A4D444D
MKKVNILIACITLLFSAFSFALDLDKAKEQGLVGEKDTGYLGAVVNKPEVLELVAEINAKRRDVYIDLAKKNNIKLSEVEILAAKKAYQKTVSGQYLWQNGEWVKK